MPYVVDTVALIRHLEGADSLGSAARAILDDPGAELVFPAIVLAEARHIIEKKFPVIDFTAIARAIRRDSRCAVYPVDLDLVLSAPGADHLEIHDGLIYATAAAVAARLQVSLSSVPILTNDRALRAFGAPVVW
jgi:predicted nucleic acid-binding protein